eukprot:759400-Rhodomonas_salina.1
MPFILRADEACLDRAHLCSKVNPPRRDGAWGHATETKHVGSDPEPAYPAAAAAEESAQIRRESARLPLIRPGLNEYMTPSDFSNETFWESDTLPFAQL